VVRDCRPAASTLSNARPDGRLVFANCPLPGEAEALCPRDAVARFGRALLALERPGKGQRGRGPLSGCRAWKLPPKPAPTWERRGGFAVNDPGPVVELGGQRGLAPQAEHNDGTGPFEWAVRWTYPLDWTEDSIVFFETEAGRLVEGEETPWSGPWPGDVAPPSASAADFIPDEGLAYPDLRGVP